MNAEMQSQLQFRDMMVVDISQVIAIERLGHAFPWTEGIFNDCVRVGYECVVLENTTDNEIVAYGVMSVAAGEAHVFNVCVKQEFQRQGLGRYMMEHLMSVAKEKQAATIYLEVRPTNTPAISLYEKMGFNQEGRRKNYYPDHDGREDAIIMAQKL